MSEGSQKVVIAALIGNAGIAVAKFIAAAITGSSAMLAEAFHSSTDTINELLLLVGLKRSKRPPDALHPFGHGKELYFWGVIVAVCIFALGGGFSIIDGIYRLLRPTPLEDPTWSYVVLGIAAVFEGYSWTVSLREIRRRKWQNESYWCFIRRSKDPALFTPFVEDTAALIGIVIAFLGVSLSHVFETPALDASASILIGLLLVAISLLLVVETKDLLVGESVSPTRVDDLKRIIQSDEAVIRVGDLLTMQLGPEEVLLTADIGFRHGLDVQQLELAVDRIEARVRTNHPQIKRIFFETEGLKGNQNSRAA